MLGILLFYENRYLIMIKCLFVVTLFIKAFCSNFYISTKGSDLNDCLEPGDEKACLTFKGAFLKKSSCERLLIFLLIFIGD
jgi:hypothetical protein